MPSIIFERELPCELSLDSPPERTGIGLVRLPAPRAAPAGDNLPVSMGNDFGWIRPPHPRCIARHLRKWNGPDPSPAQAAANSQQGAAVVKEEKSPSPGWARQIGAGIPGIVPGKRFGFAAAA